MQIVIELSDETYKDIKEENGIYGINNGLSARMTGKVVEAIQNGTPQRRNNVGTIRNEMTIVHHYNKDKLKKVRKDALKVFSQVIKQDGGVKEDIKNMISPIVNSYINGEYTFVINGDCSKSGWETSERFHDTRMKWCEKHKHDVKKYHSNKFW